ncbi:Uncharacterised protein [Mycobacteroides abscessus subsp. massiliense]|nr:Uncharacterised protein [Mycobacteroides abscessus subsp. massiliense]
MYTAFDEDGTKRGGGYPSLRPAAGASQSERTYDDQGVKSATLVCQWLTVECPILHSVRVVTFGWHLRHR